MVRFDNVSLCLTESHRKALAHRAISPTTHPPTRQTLKMAQEAQPGPRAWPSFLSSLPELPPPIEHGSPSKKCEGNYDAHCTVGVVISLRIF